MSLICNYYFYNNRSIFHIVGCNSDNRLCAYYNQFSTVNIICLFRFLIIFFICYVIDCNLMRLDIWMNKEISIYLSNMLAKPTRRATVGAAKEKAHSPCLDLMKGI